MAEGRYTHKSNDKGGMGTAEKPTGGAQGKAESTAGSPPKINEGGKDDVKHGNDPGPSAGHDATWGVVAERQARERDDHNKMTTREMEEMHARHSDIKKAMDKRHGLEMAGMGAPKMGEGVSGAGDKAAKTAGDGPSLGETKGEGKGGSEP